MGKSLELKLKERLKPDAEILMKIIKNKWVLGAVVTLTMVGTSAEIYLKTHPEYIPYVERSLQYMDRLSDKLNLFNYIF